MSPNEKENLPKGVTLREHVYDGIEEYDQRLPNWWLWTFYGAIILSVVYWISFYQSRVIRSDEERLADALEVIEAKRLEQVGELNDETLISMSKNTTFVAAGKAVYEVNCVVCHLGSLRGKEEGGIGESLADNNWLYGETPMDIYRVVHDGSPNKASGMQAWGASLGPQKVAQVTAYILSHHQHE